MKFKMLVLIIAAGCSASPGNSNNSSSPGMIPGSPNSAVSKKFLGNINNAGLYYLENISNENSIGFYDLKNSSIMPNGDIIESIWTNYKVITNLSVTNTNIWTNFTPSDIYRYTWTNIYSLSDGSFVWTNISKIENVGPSTTIKNIVTNFQVKIDDDSNTAYPATNFYRFVYAVNENQSYYTNENKCYYKRHEDYSGFNLYIGITLNNKGLYQNKMKNQYPYVRFENEHEWLRRYYHPGNIDFSKYDQYISIISN